MGLLAITLRWRNFLGSHKVLMMVVIPTSCRPPRIPCGLGSCNGKGERDKTAPPLQGKSKAEVVWHCLTLCSDSGFLSTVPPLTETEEGYLLPSAAPLPAQLLDHVGPATWGMKFLRVGEDCWRAGVQQRSLSPQISLSPPTCTLGRPDPWAQGIWLYPQIAIFCPVLFWPHKLMAEVARPTTLLEPTSSHQFHLCGCISGGYAAESLPVFPGWLLGCSSVPLCWPYHRPAISRGANQLQATSDLRLYR